ncbi:MAG: histidine phosphatase family protein, partial [Sphaerimonospora mesophila]
MKIYFVRHGQTDFNAGKAYASGDIDHELNEIGIEQAQQARNQLKDTSFDIIISSPLRRAKKTAEIINEYHGQEIQFDERIK